MRMTKLGVLGGSFNPIHLGHVALAQQARQQMGLDEVVLIPTGTPPHKPEGLAPAADRLAMASLAVAGHPHLRVSDMEVNRQGVSYTVDTLRELSAQQPDTALSLIIGADSLLDLKGWRTPEVILGMASLIVWHRPGYKPQAVEACAGFWQAQGARIAMLSLTGPDLSSTQIRSRLSQGQPVDGLVPPQVAAYLGEKGLYRGPSC